MSTDRNLLVCVFCGRVGKRGFRISSGTGDGTSDTYRCDNEAACERRRKREEAKW